MTTIAIIGEVLFAGLLLALCVGAVALTMRHAQAREDPLLQDWAKRDGVELLHAEPRIMRIHGSPWIFLRFGQRLYRITGRDSHGAVIHGWARCTGIFPGHQNVKVEGFWD